MSEQGPGSAAIVRGVIGALVGAAAGIWLFDFLLTKDLYAQPVPGAAVGMLCSIASGKRSWLLAGMCGVLGLLAGALAEHAAFVADDWDVVAALGALGELEGGHLFRIVVGVVIAIWFGLGRDRPTKERSAP
jgi:hypothetical protein